MNNSTQPAKMPGLRSGIVIRRSVVNHVAPAMREARNGQIINISSGTVPQGAPGFMHYVTSKSAIIGMTRVMARELSDFDINVNTLMPGASVVGKRAPSL